MIEISKSCLLVLAQFSLVVCWFWLSLVHKRSMSALWYWEIATQIQSNVPTNLSCSRIKNTTLTFDFTICRYFLETSSLPSMRNSKHASRCILLACHSLKKLWFKYSISWFLFSVIGNFRPLQFVTWKASGTSFDGHEFIQLHRSIIVDFIIIRLVMNQIIKNINITNINIIFSRCGCAASASVLFYLNQSIDFLLYALAAVQLDIIREQHPFSICHWIVQTSACTILLSY